MYAYDSYDQQMVDTRVAEFRDQTRRRLDGTLSEEKFRPLRLQNGLYLQLHAYMLRVAVPYGTLSSAQMRMLGDIADKYDRGYGHFTTRQNIQYNWIKLEDAPAILADLASVGMHAIQTSGNCIRNTTADHFAGAAPDEDFDPRPYAELLRQWSSFHPEFLALPRKVKICVIASDTDRPDDPRRRRRCRLSACGPGNAKAGGGGRRPGSRRCRVSAPATPIAQTIRKGAHKGRRRRRRCKVRAPATPIWTAQGLDRTRTACAARVWPGRLHVLSVDHLCVLRSSEDMCGHRQRYRHWLCGPAFGHFSIQRANLHSLSLAPTVP